MDEGDGEGGVDDGAEVGDVLVVVPIVRVSRLGRLLLTPVFSRGRVKEG